MRRRPAPPLTVRAVYRISELADAAGMDRFAMRRLLLSRGVIFVTSGRAKLVMLSELKEKLRDLWDSLIEVETLRSAAAKRRE